MGERWGKYDGGKLEMDDGRSWARRGKVGKRKKGGGKEGKEDKKRGPKTPAEA